MLLRRRKSRMISFRPGLSPARRGTLSYRCVVLVLFYFIFYIVHVFFCSVGRVAVLDSRTMFFRRDLSFLSCRRLGARVLTAKLIQSIGFYCYFVIFMYLYMYLAVNGHTAVFFVRSVFCLLLVVLTTFDKITVVEVFVGTHPRARTLVF